MPHPKIPIGISACLLGEAVRYDGGHKRHSYIEGTLGEYFQFQAFCPELAIGLGVPRPPLRLVNRESGVHCVEIRNPQQDVTLALQQCADQQHAIHAQLCGYILKKDSPSCGMERVRVYVGEQAVRSGAGIFARRLMDNFPQLPVEEEGRLGDAVLRENFIQRVFVYHRWQQLLRTPYTLADLTRFHARHKLIIMSHDPAAVSRLGGLLARATPTAELPALARSYLDGLMQTLKVIATRGKHTNVLQHVQGYLKRDLDRDDKLELGESIEQYRAGLVPLIVPITLLRHHFRKAPADYISESFYMAPYPAELCLLNEV